MGLIRKQMLAQLRASYELTLKERLSFLSAKGIQPAKADRDTIVKKLKANVRAVNRRLMAIAENDRRSEEAARIKAEKASAPREAQEGGKGQKPKKGPEEGKGKKAKPEGGKPQKKAEPPAEGKAEPKKGPVGPAREPEVK